MLGLVARHRVLTTDHLLAVEFGSRTRAQHRLHELNRMDVLWRFRFSRAAGGSYPWHYTLGYTGARLVAAQKAVRPPRPAEHQLRLERLAESPTLRHLLGVNDFFTSLAGFARRRGWPDPNVLDGTGLDTWLSETEITDYHIGEVRPDGYGCWAEHGRLLRFYLEFDTGTETLDRVARKLDGYGTVSRSADHPLYGMILFTVATARRERGLRAVLAKQHCPTPIATTARDYVHADGPAGPVWALLRPGIDAGQRVRLGQLPGLVGGVSDNGTRRLVTKGVQNADYTDVEDADEQYVELPDTDL